MDQEPTVSNDGSFGEVNLPEVVNSMQKLTVDMKPEPEAAPEIGRRRSLRKRKPRKLVSEPEPKCRMRAKKRCFEEMETEDQIKCYYLDKTVKKNTNSLETIFEEKEDLSPSKNYMSAKRFKRWIQFSNEPTASKIKKRRDKVKRIFSPHLSFRRNILSMNALLHKLNGVQNDEPVQNVPEEG